MSNRIHSQTNMNQLIKNVFTKFPYAIATYVGLALLVAIIILGFNS